MRGKKGKDRCRKRSGAEGSSLRIAQDVGRLVTVCQGFLLEMFALGLARLGSAHILLQRHCMYSFFCVHYYISIFYDNFYTLYEPLRKF